MSRLVHYKRAWFDTLSFSPPLPDNDMEVTEEPPKEGEWQNISWLPFHLNTSIKAHRGWVSGVASAYDSDLLGFAKQTKLNVYVFSDKLNPRPDSSLLKILHVRCITLQELISKPIPNTILFIRLTGTMPSDHLKRATKKQQSYIPPQRAPGDSTNTNCQRIMLLSTHHLGTKPEGTRYCLSG